MQIQSIPIFPALVQPNPVAQLSLHLIRSSTFSVGNRLKVHSSKPSIQLLAVLVNDVEDWDDRPKHAWRQSPSPDEEEGQQFISPQELSQEQPHPLLVWVNASHPQ